MNKFKKLLVAGLVCTTAVAGGLCLTGCGNNETDTESEIHRIYDKAVAAGYQGTYEEWLASIKGEKGDKGDSGKSAYEIYCGYKVNYIGSEADWLNDMISGKLMLVATKDIGDVNGDGEVNTKDALRLERYLAGVETEANLINADVDGSGTVDSRDLDVLRKYFAGWDINIPLAYKWGDINLDGKVDRADYNLLNNETSYNNLTTLQRYLGTFGYDLRRDQSKVLLDYYLQGKINNFDIPWGDANGDGIINMVDVLSVSQYLAGQDVVINLVAADVDLNGVVGKADEKLLSYYINDGCKYNADGYRVTMPMVIKWGDVNEDGTVNGKDVTLLRRYIAGEDVIINCAIADVDASGDLDQKDVDVLKKYVAGYEITLPLNYAWGDVNMDGEIDETDYNLLNNEESYNSLNSLQKYLATFGYDLTREQAVALINNYLEGKINKLDVVWGDVNLDGKVDQNDYDVLSSDTSYATFSDWQKHLATFGYNLRRDQALVLIKYYLDEKIDNFNILWGDANGDGEVQTKDTLRIAKYVAGQEVEINLVAADIDLNGKVDKADFQLLTYYTYNSNEYGVTLPMAYQWGDVNEDGTVNDKDVTMLRRYIDGEDVDICSAIGDLDLNGVRDERDVDVLRKYLSGYGITLPLTYEWGDINLDGEVNEADYNLLADDSYDSLTALQKYLGTFGYDYSKEEALPLFRQYLDGEVESMAPRTEGVSLKDVSTVRSVFKTVGLDSLTDVGFYKTADFSNSADFVLDNDLSKKFNRNTTGANTNLISVYKNGTKIVFVSDGTIFAPINCHGLFSELTALTSVNFSNFNTSDVTDMTEMFAYCSNLTSLDLSSFDTAKVTSMKSMFRNNEKLATLNIQNFNTSKVVTMYGMFGACSALTELNLTHFSTSNVTDMMAMFNSCTGLTGLNVSSFDTSKVTNMRTVFFNCSSLTSLDVSNFNTSNVTDMCGMFGNCSKLARIDVSNFDTSKVTDMSGMFKGLGLTSDATEVTIVGLANINTSKVTDMENMFSNNESYTGSGKLTNTSLAGISDWDVSKVVDMTCMFYGQGTNLTTLDLSKWNTESCVSFNHMFTDCFKLTALDLTNWNTKSLRTAYNMFNDCRALTSLGDISNWNTSNLLDAGQMFTRCTSLIGKLDLSNWDTSNLLGMIGVFDGCSGLTEIDISSWDTTKVNMSLTEEDVKSWPFYDLGIYYSFSDKNEAGIAQNVFRNCSSLTQILVGEKWDDSKFDENAFTGCSISSVTKKS